MIRFFSASLAVLVLACGCTTSAPRQEAAPVATAMEKTLAELSLKQLDQAALFFRVAFDKSLESWQGAGDQMLAGCKVSGEKAENVLAEVRPWLDRRAGEEARRVVEAPKTYRLPIDEEACSQDCSCGLGLRVLEAAELEKQSHSRVKDLKKLRSKLKAKVELISAERAEYCAETMTWICTSGLLK
jgi:hypothetical protein